MSNLYTSSPTRKINYSITSASKDTFIRLEIAKDISSYCTKPLLVSLRQMSKDIAHFIVTDFTTKGSE